MKMNPLSFAKRSCRNESGVAAVEFAFIGMILIVLTLGVFELGRVAFTYQKLLSAVGGATRLVEIGASDTVIHDIINSKFLPSEQGALTFDIGPQVVDGVSYRRIDVRYALPLIMPNFGLFSGGTVNVKALQLVPIT
jgi:hypothetical protein